MMRLLAGILLLAFSLPLAAQQSGVVNFGAPIAGGAPAGYRLYRDGALVGPVTAGQTVPNLFPANTGAWTFAVEAHNAACGTTPLPACPRVTPAISPTVLGPPPLLPPGPVINVTITAPCATASPPTCTINVVTP
jgi:hypothetical protein